MTLAGRIGKGLRDAGFAVDVVHDGAAALEAAASTEYDVVVLDRDLPGVHGDRVCRDLARGGYPARVLMLTAAAGVEDRGSGLVKETLLGQATMYGKNGRAGRHDQERTPRNSLDVAAEAEQEARGKVDDAPGFRIVHVLEVDDYRNFLAEVFTDGDGIPEVSRPHYCDLDTAAHGELAIRGFIIALNLADVLGGIAVLAAEGVIVMPDGTEPSAGVPLHYADLRRYEPMHGCPSGETVADD